MNDTLSIFWSPMQNQNKKCSSNTRTCPTHITRRSFCMMPQFAKQRMDNPHPHSGPQGKSELGLQRADWTSDHCHCQ